MYRITGLACGFLVASSCLTQAQVVTTTTTTSAPSGSIRVSQILGSTVQLQGTNEFGKVEDIVLSEDGSPAYLVVANGGRHAMFPYSGANFQLAQKTVSYDVTPQAVQPLFFSPNAYPNVTDPQFTTRTSQAFPATGSEKVKIKVRPNGTIKEKIRDR